MAKRNVKLNVVGKKFKTRCSSLPLLFSCTNAIHNPDKLVRAEVEFSAAGLGTDIHLAIQKTIETGTMDLRKIEAKYPENDVERAKMLYFNGLKIVDEARSDMKNPQFEQEISFESEHYSVTGHVDLLDLSSSTAYVVDFKTGRTRDDHYHQMAGYAVGAWTKVGRPARFIVRVAYVYLESMEVTNLEFTADDMGEWLRELDGLFERYTVGRRCVYCPLQNSCPAFRDYLRGSLTLLLEVSKLPTVNIRRLTEDARKKLALSLKMAQFAVQRIRDFIKEDAMKNGEIKTGDGNKYVIRTRENRVLLTSKALPVIAKYVTPRDIANATKLRLTDIISAAARRVKGPMRKVIRDELNKNLEKAGAIITTESAYLETVVDKPEKQKCQPKTTKPRSGTVAHRRSRKSK